MQKTKLENGGERDMYSKTTKNISKRWEWFAGLWNSWQILLFSSAFCIFKNVPKFACITPLQSKGGKIFFLSAKS